MIVLTEELLDYLGDIYQREHIGLTHFVMFDDFVELWIENKWEEFANACS